MSADENQNALPPDGNAVAGLLCEVFTCEMTVAVITCGGCGAAAPVGAVRVFGGAMGAIFRCATCETAAPVGAHAARNLARPARRPQHGRAGRFVAHHDLLSQTARA